MKIKVNVLPDKQKEKILEEKKVGFILKLGFSFMAVLWLINVVLFLMQVVLKIEYKAASRSSEQTFTGNAGKENQLEKIFQDTSKDVTSISKIKAEIPNWARVLARVSEICPDEIRMNQLSAEDTHLKISGFSKTRDAFLDFQNKLKSEGFQFSVDISNLVASQNFNFDLDLTIPKDYLIRQ